jgi:hypothetical protein
MKLTLKVNDKYLKSYRGSNVKYATGLSDCKIYKTKAGAKNTKKKLEGHGFVCELIDMVTSTVEISKVVTTKKEVKPKLTGKSFSVAFTPPSSFSGSTAFFTINYREYEEKSVRTSGDTYGITKEEIKPTMKKILELHGIGKKSFIDELEISDGVSFIDVV